MPSHFHSTCQSERAPKDSGGSASGAARKNGYGRAASRSEGPAAEGDPRASGPPASGPAEGAVRAAKKGSDGSQGPISRCATVAAGSCAACATARTAKVSESPTRSSPVSSLLKRKISRRPSSLQQARTRTS
ncbi:MAG: hypothetical protein NVS4B10_08590 [Myxococcales bacterium]